MDPIDERKRLLTRRHFFSRTSTGLGAAALSSLLPADLRADMIVIATHGLTGLRPLLFGSTTEKVTKLAHCNVLVIRVPRTQGSPTA